MKSYRELFELIDKMEFDDGDFELPSFFSMPAPPPPIYKAVDQPLARQQFPPPPDRTFPDTEEEESEEAMDEPLTDDADDLPMAAPQPQPWDEDEEAGPEPPARPSQEIPARPSPYQQAWDEDLTSLEQAKQPVAVPEPFVPTPVAEYQPDDWDDEEPETALPAFDESKWPPRAPAENTAPASSYTAPAEKDAPAKKKRNTLSWIANAMVVLVFITIIGGTVLFIFANNSDMSIFGYRLFHVISDSMDPVAQPDGEVLPGGFRENDAIIVRVVDAHQVEVGDIITICREATNQTPLTHRVTHVLYNFYDDTGVGFLTRGDNNAYSDPPAGGSQLLGIKVASIPRVGYLFTFAQEHVALAIGICIVLIVGVFVLFIISLRKAAAELEKQQRESGLILPPGYWDAQDNTAKNAAPQSDWTAQPAFANRR